MSIACCALVLFATPVRAQDAPLPARTLSPLFTQSRPFALAAVDADRPRAALAAPQSDRGLLMPLYVSFASLQMLDAHSTIRALRAGGVEQNPLMKGVAGHPAALVAVKAGVAVSTIALAEKVRRRSRFGAIVLMAAVNSVYATVVAHNYRSLP